MSTGDGANKKGKGARDLAKTARLSAVWSIGSRGGLRLFNLGAAVVLARLLTPADFGVVAASRFFVTLATRLTQFGLGSALVRQKSLSAAHTSSVFVANLVLGATAFIVVMAASPYLGAFVNNAAVSTVLPVSALVFLITPLQTVANALLNRELRYQASVGVKVATTVVGTLVSVSLALFGFGYWSLVIGALAGSVVSAVSTLYLSAWLPSLRFSVRAFRDVASFGVGIQAKRLVEFGASNLDSLLVGRFLGVTSLGFYDKGYGLMIQLTDRMAFDGVLFRAFSMINHDPARLRKALNRTVQAVTLLSFPGLVFLTITAEPMIVTVFGSQWEPAVGPFQVMAIAGLFRMAARPIVAANESLGLVWKQTGQQMLVLIALITGVSVGARWGVTGAASGVLLAAVVHAVANSWLLLRTTPVSLRDLWWACLPAMATSVAIAGAVVATGITLNFLGLTNNLLILAIDTAVGATCYAALLVWTPFRSVRLLVNQSVDDVTPWLPLWVRVGALRSA